FEVQPVYPLGLDDPARGFRNLPYLSAGFLDALGFAARTAHELGLRMDITLASGWPYGGPHIPVAEASARLRCDRVAAPEGARSLAAPDMENGEKLLAVFLARGDRSHFPAQGIEQIHTIERGRLQLPAGLDGPHVVLFFIASRTGQMVKRPAVGAEGFVLNHYSLPAIATHLATVGDRLIEACGPNPPYAVFSDSLEVYGADWTDDFLDQFHKRRGYDLTPYLPALVGDIGEKTSFIRHDWGQTLTELAGERYLTPIREWAHRHGTRFRSQTYGTPPVSLSSNALVDLPEGEGPQWRSFSATRWASSASHLYGRPVTSSETWTWLHSPAFRATPLDMKAEADLHFLEGINQLIGHGWPYSPPEAGEPGWRFYAAAVFNNHNPWWLVMPEITKYLQRVSFALRQGKPANDVAIYLPTDDAWAKFTAGRVSVNGLMQTLLGPDLIPAVLDAGYDFDFIDDGAIAQSGIHHRVLILPGVERIPLSTYRRLEAFLREGGIVLATRRAPSLAPGLRDTAQTAQIEELSRTLLKTPGRVVADETELG
ncbi:MAG: glycosyl hydrolase, partial [Bryobacteraceae bacterium]